MIHFSSDKPARPFFKEIAPRTHAITVVGTEVFYHIGAGTWWGISAAFCGLPEHGDPIRGTRSPLLSLYQGLTWWERGGRAWGFLIEFTCGMYCVRQPLASYGNGREERLRRPLSASRPPAMAGLQEMVANPAHENLFGNRSTPQQGR